MRDQDRLKRAFANIKVIPGKKKARITISLPEDLLRKITTALPATKVDSFIQQAIEEKMEGKSKTFGDLATIMKDMENYK